MRDTEIVNRLAQALVLSCGGGMNELCSCGAVTDIWAEVAPSIEQRAIRLGLRKKPHAEWIDGLED